MAYDKGGRTAGDDQPMATKDRAGYSVEIELMTGGRRKDIEEDCSTEVGNPQPIDGGAPLPKV